MFWTGARPGRARFDLWRWNQRLRLVMRSPRLWNPLLLGLVSWVFVLVNLWLWLWLWLCPQDRAHNGSLNLFWAWWWPLILLSFPLVVSLAAVMAGASWLPAWSADPHVIAFCQSTAVLLAATGRWLVALAPG